MTSLPLVAVATTGCTSAEDPPAPAYDFVVATFNTGTTERIGDVADGDGYGPQQGEYSDLYYGNGLAWVDVVSDTRAFFAQSDVDVVVFQEIFYSGDCPSVPEEARPGFVCETWQPGDPTVAQLILGDGWQVACHLGKNDKCAAVRRSFGSFRGCDADLCLDGLDGASIDMCGSGSRIGRGVIDRVDGGTLTVVNVHGTSGIDDESAACRAQQFRQVFVDLDGEPAASGEANLVMGDFNTDPARAADVDPSAQVLADNAIGEGKAFHFVSEVGPDAEPTYAGLFNIDHVIADVFDGTCWVPGISEGHPDVTDAIYFDHHPVVCGLQAR